MFIKILGQEAVSFEDVFVQGTSNRKRTERRSYNYMERYKGLQFANVNPYGIFVQHHGQQKTSHEKQWEQDVLSFLATGNNIDHRPPGGFVIICDERPPAIKGIELGANVENRRYMAHIVPTEIEDMDAFFNFINEGITCTHDGELLLLTVNVWPKKTIAAKVGSGDWTYTGKNWIL